MAARIVNADGHDQWPIVDWPYPGNVYTTSVQVGGSGGEGRGDGGDSIEQDEWAKAIPDFKLADNAAKAREQNREQNHLRCPFQVSLL